MSKKKQKTWLNTSKTQAKEENAAKPHKLICKVCRFHGYASGLICDYLCVMWDETGVPKMRPCPAEECTVFEPIPPGYRKPKQDAFTIY